MSEETNDSTEPQEPKSDAAEKNAEEKASENRGPRWGEMMKELTLTGLATVFMTEDSVRNYLKEKKLPKELVGLVLDGIGKKKDDFYGLLAKEFGKMLNKVDVTKEVSKFLEEHHVSVEAKISFQKKENKS